MSEEKAKRMTALVLTISQEDKFQFESIVKSRKELKDARVNFTVQFYDGFKEGKVHKKFDFVIAAILNAENEADDIEMQEEIFKHYADAPVWTWLITKSDGQAAVKDFAQGVKSANFSLLSEDSKEAKANALIEALGWSRASHATLTNETVKPAFNEYDTDGSGAIDSKELSNLCEKLEHPLDEEQLAAAFKDLDTNGDGVIDFSEFSKWYFSGFQPYDGSKRAMKVIKTGA